MTEEKIACVISVIISGDSGADKTRLLVEEVISQTNSFKDPIEIIVVAEQAEVQLKQLGGSIRVLVKSPDVELSDVLQGAIDHAGGEYLVFIDAAGDYSPECISALIDPLKLGSHDLVVASHLNQRKVNQSITNQVSAWLSKKLLSFFTEVSDPLSGLYAFRRETMLQDQLVVSSGINLLAALLRQKKKIRILEIEAIPHQEENSSKTRSKVSVLSVIQQLISLVVGYDFVSQDKRSKLNSIIAFVTDITLAFIMVALGFSIVDAHVSGFIAGITTIMLLHTVATRNGPQTRPSRQAVTGIRSGARFLVIAILSLALRGGVMATLIIAGMPEFVAIVIGIAMGWVVIYFGKAYLFHANAQGSSTSHGWTLAALGIIAYVLVLRLFVIGALEAMPQEAYYWNYSIRLSPGYLDHPPMVAVLIWLGEFIFGHSEFGLRIASYLCGFALLLFVYLYAKQLVDRSTALVATALAVILPYYFFGSGLFITPDAALAVAWAMSIYYFHRALVSGDKRAWYGVGLGMGLGMLSKYTIALLGPAALLYLVLDKNARRWFIRPQPYMAVVIALVVFTPVIYWNATNEWASFQFQAQDRFHEQPKFSVPLLFQNIISVVTPLPLLLIPLLFVSRWKKNNSTILEPKQVDIRNRLFVACFVLVPLAVFVWNSIKNEPRLNWTGPIWLAMLPMMAWCVVQALNLRWNWLGIILRKGAAPMFAGILVVYAVTLHYLTVGLPGAEFPKGLARFIGWPQAALQLQQIQHDIMREGGEMPIVVGLDKYFIPSKFSFYGTVDYLSKIDSSSDSKQSIKPLRVTGVHLLDDQSLMFSYWDPIEQFRDRTVIMVARSPGDLSDARVGRFFQKLNPDINSLPLVKSPLGGNPITVREYYYRIGYGYIPPETNTK